MAVITAVKAQKRDEERVSIYIDGAFAFGTSRMAAAARNLHVGRVLDLDDIESLRREDDVERALNAALNVLSYRPRSHREILNYFRRKGTDPAIVEAVTERLQRMGLLDDREFAAFWVRNRQMFSPRGTRALRAEMRQKGVDAEIVNDALTHIDDEEPLAYTAAAKKARALRSLDDHDFLRRLIAFLQRRGFTYNVSARVAQRLRSELDGTDTDLDVALEPE